MVFLSFLHGSLVLLVLPIVWPHFIWLIQHRLAMGFDNIWHGLLPLAAAAAAGEEPESFPLWKDRKLIDWDKWSIAVASAEVCQWCAIAKWISVSGKHASFDKMTHARQVLYIYTTWLASSWKIQMNYDGGACLPANHRLSWMSYWYDTYYFSLKAFGKRLSLPLVVGGDLSRGNWTITMAGGKKRSTSSSASFSCAFPSIRNKSQPLRPDYPITFSEWNKWSHCMSACQTSEVTNFVGHALLSFVLAFVSIAILSSITVVGNAHQTSRSQKCKLASVRLCALGELPKVEWYSNAYNLPIWPSFNFIG